MKLAMRACVLAVWVGGFSPAAAATYTVTNTNDSGAGSLRKAINDANANSGLDTIVFNIPGTGVKTVILISALPTITSPVDIDGTTQPGFSSTPLIELNGASAGSGVHGLHITAGGSTVEALAINRFTGAGSAGIRLEGAGGNSVLRCFVGTNAAGTASLANTNGIWIEGSPNNTIGGTTAAVRNIISGNTTDGVKVNGSGATGNVIQGNYIGTDVTGTVDLGHIWNGISIVGAANNTVGGTATGAGNVISGNDHNGVALATAGATGNQILGNYIGLNAAGTAALPNSDHGVRINGVPSNTVGGTVAGARNVISGNADHGISIEGSGATGNTVLGNYIGTNAAGTASVANANGIWIEGSPNNTIGGTTAASRNIISGNTTDGIRINGSGATGNVIRGNYIGTDVTGTVDLGHVWNGISIVGAANNTVGGTASGAGNVISGNDHNGVALATAGATGNQILGNYIGLNAAGTAALPNSDHGVRINGVPSNTVGGTVAGARNVISGNADYGISIEGSGATGNTVLGNYIGTNAAGTASVANANGIWIEGSPNNTIGGTTSAARNIISGNTTDGIRINGSGATGNVIQGNYIGTDVTGTVDLGHIWNGISIVGAANNTVGGTASGAGNVISGNDHNGVALATAGATENQILGNYIGTNAAGTAALPNSNDGIRINDVPSNTIGGTAAGSANLISGNGWYGVEITGAGADRNRLHGNTIGLNMPGGILGNKSGILIANGADSTIIGGTMVGARNVISGNTGSSPWGHGIEIDGSTLDATGTLVQGNYIGTGTGGTTICRNLYSGIHIRDASGTVVGGTSASARNVISGNHFHGVSVFMEHADNTCIQGNYIGLDVTGSIDLGNEQCGITVLGGPDNTVIGGTVAGAGNVISGNGACGIRVESTGTDGTLIQNNIIGLAASGTSVVGNGSSGIEVSTSVSNTSIGGTSSLARNIISGNDWAGVYVNGSLGSPTGTVIQGNYIGTDISGMLALGNDGNGICIEAANDVVIGGTSAGTRNVISSNAWSGIAVLWGAEANSIQGNYVGVNASGTAVLGNSLEGVSLFLTVKNTTVGGAVSGAGNVISGNGFNGIRLGDHCVANVIQGNYIGTNPAGTADWGNAGSGIAVFESDSTTIGGTTTLARNLISGNDTHGISLSDTSGWSTIQGNYIGLRADGATLLGNGGHGIAVELSPQTTIGGTVSSAANRIAGNGSAGVVVHSALNARISCNAVWSNTNLGIDLSGDGVTANDTDDPDTGANNLQNYPVLSSVAVAGGSTVIQGSLNSTPSTTFRVELFSSAAADPSYHGEGQTYLGATNVTTNASGDAAFSVTIPSAVATGHFVTATATDPAGNTSEFSQGMYVVPPMVLTAADLGGTLQLSWTAIGPAAEYWLYGTDTAAYFVPEGSPTYLYRITTIPAGTLTWSTTTGMGDPNSDWTYLVMAVGADEFEICRSTRAGEREFTLPLP